MISDSKRKIEEINFSEQLHRHLHRQPLSNFISREERRDIVRAALLPIADQQMNWAHTWKQKYELVFAQPLELTSTTTNTTSQGN